MEKELRAVRELTPTVKRQERRDGDGENEPGDTDQGLIVGYAVKWDQLSKEMWGFQEKFARGAFTASLADGSISVYAAWNHDSANVIGRAPTTLKLEEDEIGLRYEIDPPDWADRYLETIERGDVFGSSFIFRPIQQEWDESNPDMAIRTITQAELYEVSPVTTPAYPTATVGVRSAESVMQEYRNSKIPAVNVLKQKQRQRELDILGRV